MLSATYPLMANTDMNQLVIELAQEDLSALLGCDCARYGGHLALVDAVVGRRDEYLSYCEMA